MDDLAIGAGEDTALLSQEELSWLHYTQRMEERLVVAKKAEAVKEETYDEQHAIVVDAVDDDDVDDDDEDKEDQAEENQVAVKRYGILEYLRDYLRLFAVIGSVLIIGTQTLAIMLVSETNVLQLVLRVYILLFCFGFVLTELELPLLWMKVHTVLEDWRVRGAMYSFIGVVGAEETYSGRRSVGFDGPVFQDNELGKMVAFAAKGSSYVLIGAGAVYFVFGLLCIQHVFRKQQAPPPRKRTKAQELRTRKKHQVVVSEQAPPREWYHNV
mmetsp:Transcript_4552/g.6917  ORF Transcript_4552/g.6917 Transcript_4552/m.6917 type:complete len:270 (+) Transcript_4552:173-982(+)